MPWRMANSHLRRDPFGRNRLRYTLGRVIGSVNESIFAEVLTSGNKGALHLGPKPVLATILVWNTAVPSQSDAHFLLRCG